MLESLMLLQIDCTAANLADALRDSMDIVWLFIGLLIGNNLDYLRIDKTKEDKGKRNNKKFIYCYLYRLYPVVVMLCAVFYYLFAVSSILLHKADGFGCADLLNGLIIENRTILVSNIPAAIVCAGIPGAVCFGLLYVYWDNLTYLKATKNMKILFAIFTFSCFVCTAYLINSNIFSSSVFFIFGGLAALLYTYIYICYNDVTHRGIGKIRKRWDNMCENFATKIKITFKNK